MKHSLTNSLICCFVLIYYLSVSLLLIITNECFAVSNGLISWLLLLCFNFIAVTISIKNYQKLDAFLHEKIYKNN